MDPKDNYMETLTWIRKERLKSQSLIVVGRIEKGCESTQYKDVPKRCGRHHDNLSLSGKTAEWHLRGT